MPIFDYSHRQITLQRNSSIPRTSQNLLPWSLAQALPSGLTYKLSILDIARLIGVFIRQLLWMALIEGARHSRGERLPAGPLTPGVIHEAHGHLATCIGGS